MITVRWKRSALNELANLWTQAKASQRQAITAASHEIDRQLQDDPGGKGESRSQARRILFVPPLGITFHVKRQASVVFVLHVWRYRQLGE